jgi:hypothetical protein
MQQQPESWVAHVIQRRWVEGTHGCISSCCCEHAKYCDLMLTESPDVPNTASESLATDAVVRASAAITRTTRTPAECARRACERYAYSIISVRVLQGVTTRALAC